MYAEPTPTTRALLLLAFVALASAALVLPHGTLTPVMEARWDPATRREIIGHDDARMTMYSIANSAGQVALALTLGSLVLPYVKRPWATRTHRILGAPILLLAALHTALYLGEGSTRGWLPGMLSFAAFGAHGATGALKAALLRAWGPAWWRLVHRGSGWAALALVVEHVLIASWHLGFARWFAA